MKEVIGLEDHVAEFGKGDAHFQSRFDRVLGQHGANGEVFANVSKEGNQLQLAEPFVVVDHASRIVLAGEIEELFKLALIVCREGFDDFKRI